MKKTKRNVAVDLAGVEICVPKRLVAQVLGKRRRGTLVIEIEMSR